MVVDDLGTALSWLAPQHGFAAVGKEFLTEGAMAPITSASCTEFTAVKNDLQVQTVPIPLRKEALEIPFRLLNTLATAEPPTLG